MLQIHVKRSLDNKRVNPVVSLYYLYFILKPFYLKASGTVQMAEVCLLASWILSILCGLCKNRLMDFRLMHLFYLFVTGAGIVNIFYAVKMHDIQFIHALFYWLFNLIFLILSYELLLEEKLLEKLVQIFKLTVYVQFAIYLFHMGRWYGEVRYKGTFNDPNQFAFYLMMCGIFIFIYGIYTSRFGFGDGLAVGFAMFLIIKSASRGMTLCVALIFVFELLGGSYVWCEKIVKSIGRKKILAAFAIMGCVVVLAVCVTRVMGGSSSYTVWDRWKETVSTVKQGKGLTSGGRNAFEERGISRVWEFPQYCFFGAGEGGNARFNTWYTGEIHSTFPGILFCYGIIPFALLFIWCIFSIRKLDIKYLAVYFSLFIESCTLVHYRQPVFWLVFVIGYGIQRGMFLTGHGKTKLIAVANKEEEKWKME